MGKFEDKLSIKLGLNKSIDTNNPGKLEDKLSKHIEQYLGISVDIPHPPKALELNCKFKDCNFQHLIEMSQKHSYQSVILGLSNIQIWAKYKIEKDIVDKALTLKKELKEWHKNLSKEEKIKLKKSYIERDKDEDR